MMPVQNKVGAIMVCEVSTVEKKRSPVTPWGDGVGQWSVVVI